MAGSEASRAAQRLLEAAPEGRVDEAGEYFVEAFDIIDELKQLSPFGETVVNWQINRRPYSKSESKPMNYAAVMGYCLRIAASRRGVPNRPDHELGADLVPRSASGKVDWDTLYAETEAAQETRTALWDKVQQQMERDDIYGVDLPMWKFIAAAVTFPAGGYGKIARQVTLDDMRHLITMGYALGMVDEACGWDHTASVEGQA